MNFIFLIFLFIFGISIGSFLNALIYRINQNISILGRSFCIRCKKQILWYDLIPLISFLILKGKCRFCKNKISIQYPAVEFSTGILYFLLGIKFISNNIGFIKFLELFIIIPILIFIFVYDLKYSLIVDWIVFLGIFISLIFIFFLKENLINYILASIIGFLFFEIQVIISKEHWVGKGDVLIGVLMGVLLGVSKFLFALAIAYILGGFVAIILVLLNKKKLKSHIPLGPFLIFSTMIFLFLGDKILDWYLGIVV